VSAPIRRGSGAARRGQSARGAGLTATGYQFADGQRILRLEKVIMPDGKEMFLYGRR
jgi:hypothetical protein